MALDGFRIGQITDTHVGDFIDPDCVARAVSVLNDADVHLQVMTGDLLDDLRLIEPAFSALEKCRARYGMLAVLGNHEKMRRRLGPMLEAYARRRSRGVIRLLVDESTAIEHNGARLRVVGVDYPMHENGKHLLPRGERIRMMQRSAEKAFAGASAATETILCLSHHPEFFPLAAQRGAQLTLSGHTHGGQVAFLGRPVLSMYKYMLGQYQLADAHLYVSAGTGHWLPVRIGVPTEVSIISLHAG
jgi:predicted MPP superfamily phosphohydrolase